MKKKGTKKPIIFTSITAVLLVLGIVLNVLAFGYLRPVLDMVFATSNAKELTEEEQEKIRSDARATALDIEREGITLLANNGTLPYKQGSKKVDLLGIASVNPRYGGSGSGGISDKVGPVDVKTAFSNAGWTVNENLYQTIANSKAVSGSTLGDDRLNASFLIDEPDPDAYWNNTDSSADLAVIVYSRTGGEGLDLPTTGYEEDGTASQAGTKHYLQLSSAERKMMEKAANTYKNVVVVLNTTNILQLGDFEDFYTEDDGEKGNVDALLWIGCPGYHGMPALVESIEGKLNPSGRTTDTYAYDFMTAPAVKAYGNHTYTNAPIKGTTGSQNPNATYQEYSEGIYIGYRFYETVAELGYADYEETVEFPFGYGLSYTQFDWALDASASALPVTLSEDGNYQVAVSVTNSGSVAGKDVVELYLTFDKEELLGGSLDRSAATLVGYAKTPLLNPGESQCVVISFAAEDLASYDDRAVYSETGSYVLEKGEYTFVLRTDSHNDKGEDLTFSAEAKKAIVYNTSVKDTTNAVAVGKRPSDKTVAVNQFGTYDASILNGNKYGIGVNYLTIHSPEEEWKACLAHTTDREAPQSLVDFISNGANKSITNKGYEVHNEEGEDSANNGLGVNDFRETEYESEEWQKLVEQMTKSELAKLISQGAYLSQGIASVGKEPTVDMDGPVGFYYFPVPSKYWATGYPSPIVIAATFNDECAEAMGKAVANEGRIYGVGGWYAPGANLHRLPFGGRNYEYYSEDPVLSGRMAANVCSGATEGGLIVYLKHFVMNETEINRNNNVLHWGTEQSVRELYLKSFEYAPKADIKLNKTPTTGMMSGFNYLGDRWCGASKELLTDILRGEWNFKGTVITDYFGDYGYMDVSCGIRAGNDFMLKNVGGARFTVSSNDDLYYSQRAAKNMLYSYSRSSQTKIEFVEQTQTWIIVAVIVNIVWWSCTAVLLVISVLEWLKKFNIIGVKGKIVETEQTK